MRVVSLVPSASATLRAWGVEPVAVTRFCEQPDLPTVGGTKNPDVAAVVALAPDLVVVDREENRREDHDALVAAGLDVHVLAVRSVDDVAVQLPALADRVGVRWEPPALDRGGAARPGGRLRAFVPIWRRPWMALGRPTYGASLLDLLGVDVVAPGATAYPEVTLEQVAAAGVDVVLAPSEPYPFKKRHLAELATVAVTVPVDGKDLFWWGVRTADAVGRLRGVVAALAG